MRRTARAFTLLEVLVGIALMAALFGSMFAFVFDLLASRRRALDYAQRQMAAATMIDRLETDLMTCLVGDAEAGPGIEGDGARIVVLSRGVPVQLAGEGGDNALADLQRTAYRFDAAAGRLEAARLPPEAGATGEPARGDPPEEPPGVPLGPAARMRFRYHDGTAWRDTFDSLAAGALPMAVEVAVWFHPWPGDAPPAAVPESAAEPPPRLTFDASGAFDEQAFARRSDLDVFDEPRPDRLRVIVPVDGAAPAAGTGEPAEADVPESPP